MSEKIEKRKNNNEIMTKKIMKRKRLGKRIKRRKIL